MEATQLSAKDLRIGNYHEYLVIDKVDERQEYWQIGQIDWQDIKYLSEREEELSKLPKPPGKAVEHYRAIPLSEDVLLKLGFEKGIHGDWHKSDLKGWFTKYTTEIGVYSYQFGQYHIASVQFVHQLQNLIFALTGEELTFKN